jgi:hypothetical protein
MCNISDELNKRMDARAVAALLCGHEETAPDGVV